MPTIKWPELPFGKLAEAALNIDSASIKNHPIDFIKERLVEGIAAGPPYAEICEGALKHLDMVTTRK
ncbi:MAG: hypothetical protein Q7R95_07000 [bacterium]|nr:hypothetical protein [bacterium]